VCSSDLRNISCDVLASMVEIAAGCGQVSFGRVKPYNFAFSGKNLTFAVFGGSITEGRCVTADVKTYSFILQSHLRMLFGNHIHVLNFGVGATGPQLPMTWLECGCDIWTNIDFFVSEFKVNVRGTRSDCTKVFTQWYRAVNRMQKNLIVLDLWAWGLGGPVPSPNQLSATTALNETDPWMVDFVAASEPFWKLKAPFLSTDLYPHVPNICASAQNMRDKGKNVPMRTDCFNGLAHGHDMYHELVALAFAFNIYMSHQLYLLFDHQQRFDVDMTSNMNNVTACLNNSVIRRCYGKWGVRLSSGAANILKEYSVLNDLDDLSSKPVSSHWTFGPFIHKISAKSSYHVTEVGYPISFALPAKTVEISIQFVAHSDVMESGVFQVDLDPYSWNVSTFLGGKNEKGVRIAKFFHIQVPSAVMLSNEPFLVNIAAVAFNTSIKSQKSAVEITGLSYSINNGLH